MTWTPDVKLTLLVASTLMGSTIIFISLMMHSIGTISHLLDRFENLAHAEAETRINTYLGMFKQNRLRLINAMDHKRRQEALLAIPLVRSNKGKS